MAKILIMMLIWCRTLGGGNTNSPKLLLLNFLPLTYHHMAATFDFTFFFTLAFLGAALDTGSFNAEYI